MATINRKLIRDRIHARVRKKVHGTGERPRIAVHLSNQHITAQIIDDDLRQTLVYVTTRQKDVAGTCNVAGARNVGGILADRAIAKGIKAAVFDRGGLKYAGRVKALADAAREKGLQF